MSSEDKAKISVKVDLPTFKLQVEAEVAQKNLDAFIQALVDSIEKSAKKIEKTFGALRVTAEPSPSSVPPRPYPLGGISDPIINVARRLGVDGGKLVGNSLFGFKEDKPQIFDPGKFKSAASTARVLLFLYEVGLERRSVKYDDFKGAFELSKIKGRNLSQVVGDWTKAGSIDSARYKASEELVLSAKGMNEAIDDLKSALGLDSSS